MFLLQKKIQLLISLFLSVIDMKRITTKFDLKKKQINVDCDVLFYENGTIVFEDFKKQDYYVFDSFQNLLSFLNLNYKL